MGNILGDGGAEKRAKEAAARMEEQRKKEQTRLAEADSDINRKKALMSRGGAGRSLLIKTSPTGTGNASNLGGV